MDAVKVEQDSCETLLPVSSVCEYQLSENHTVPLIKSESKVGCSVLLYSRRFECSILVCCLYIKWDV